MSASLSFFILIKNLIKANNDVTLKIYSQSKFKKEVSSIVLYIVGILFVFISPYISIFLYAFVAVTWLIPDREIEKHFEESNKK